MQFEVASDPLELIFQWWTDAFFCRRKAAATRMGRHSGSL